LSLAALGREPVESPWHAEARATALVVAVGLDTLLLVIGALTVFGLAFVAVLVGQMFATLLLYHVAFRWLVWRRGRAAGGAGPC
jgi:membrane protein YdbS with pleckstrin-like domain